MRQCVAEELLAEVPSVLLPSLLPPARLASVQLFCLSSALDSRGSGSAVRLVPSRAASLDRPTSNQYEEIPFYLSHISLLLRLASDSTYWPVVSLGRFATKDVRSFGNTCGSYGNFAATAAARRCDAMAALTGNGSTPIAAIPYL